MAIEISFEIRNSYISLRDIRLKYHFKWSNFLGFHVLFLRQNWKIFKNVKNTAKYV